MLYPDSGADKLKTLFNSLISPTSSINDSEIFNELFFREGIQPGKVDQANHFVPVVTNDLIESFVRDEFPKLSFEGKIEPPKKKKFQSQRFIPYMPIPTSTSASATSQRKLKTIIKSRTTTTSALKSSTIFNFMKLHKTWK